MKIAQKIWTKDRGWTDALSQTFPAPPQLVLAFGGREAIEDAKRFDEIRSFYPGSHIVECSTAGEILNTKVYDGSIVVTAILLEKSEAHFVEMDITNADESAVVGKRLAEALPKEKLAHAFVFSDGLHVNGSALAKGLNESLPPGVTVTGGLVGDGALFRKTLVGLDHTPMEGKAVLIGLSGDAIKVGFGSVGGWDKFGIERVITKSSGNVLYEVDGKPALGLYKEYLGDRAKGLPGTGLLFPLRLRIPGESSEVVRTILAVNEADQSMIFAGDVPQGSIAELMKANVEHLVDGASQAGKIAIEGIGGSGADLALLVSCVGRKLVMKEHTEEELEAVRSIIGEKPVIAGFYSYGELCPIASDDKLCRLHNQTMTITVLREDLS